MRVVPLSLVADFYFLFTNSNVIVVFLNKEKLKAYNKIIKEKQRRAK